LPSRQLGLAQEQRIRADAELYTAEQLAKAAKLQEDTELAKELAILRGTKEVVQAAGNNTTFIPWNLKVDLRSADPATGRPGYWLSEEPSTSGKQYRKEG